MSTYLEILLHFAKRILFIKERNWYNDVPKQVIYGNIFDVIYTLNIIV